VQAVPVRRAWRCSSLLMRWSSLRAGHGGWIYARVRMMSAQQIAAGLGVVVP
jgi:hypothetical protein